MSSQIDQQQKRMGKTVQFGLDQFSNPTPHAAKVFFRIVLYLSAIWAVVSPSVTELPMHVLASIDKYLLLANAIINVTIKFFGWDYDSGSSPANTSIKSLLLIVFLGAAMFASSQSAFKALPKKQHGRYGLSAPTSITAFRFTGPMAGYSYPANQVVTGLGYGWQKLHWVDSTQKYYTDFSLSAVLFAGGNVNPSLEEHNIISVGLSLGVLNQLIMIGPVYNFPKGDTKGSFGVVVNFSVPLNN